MVENFKVNRKAYIYRCCLEQQEDDAVGNIKMSAFTIYVDSGFNFICTLRKHHTIFVEKMTFVSLQSNLANILNQSMYFYTRTYYTARTHF